ncbi:DctP family TRAP transporter solute-binding subunit [Ruegeria sp.]|uniref:TRAP transporter substrate-binding protein n=1 Tax=Ruegeria sp. TaxID=1879320 RepID=UPI0023279D45|nr:DctP family TRAP transporter solute-binding subunit [Ruegeria sp.]MDA7963660.1 DctP family TRAP transporter solute-binding subunit [Ruegeria sp.]
MMNSSRRSAFLACLIAVSTIAATATFAQTKTLKFGHDTKPDPFDNPAHACAAVFANIVGADTNGAVEVEIFPSAALGTATEHVQLVRDGVIQATLSSTGPLASYYPRIDVLNMPFAFDSNAMTYEVFDGPFGNALARDIENALGDVVVLGFPDTGGFFAVTNSKRKIETLDDFKNVRIRTMTLPSHQKIVQALGAEAYPLPWGEVYSALQTKTIDGQMNPIPIISFSNFSEVQPYLTLTNHLFSPYTFILNRDFWDGLNENEQRVVGYAATSCIAASRGLSRIIEASDRGLAGLVDKMEVTAFTPQQRQAMKSATQPAFEAHVQENLDVQATKLLGLLKEQLSNTR